MNKVTRKHGWPLALVLTFSIIGVLAVFVALSAQPGTAQAQTPPPTPNPLCDTPLGALLAECDDATPTPTASPTAQPTTAPTTAPPTIPPTTPPTAQPTTAPTAQPTTAPTTPTKPAADSIVDSSTSASAGVKLTLTIARLTEDMEAGSSIELYLEDDFDVPDSIDKGSVYFTATYPREAATNSGGRVYATDAVEIDTDDHYGGDDDWAIQVFLPDFNTGDNYEEFNGPKTGQTLQLVILKSGGIKNPSEAGTHSVGYSVLGPNDDANDGPEVQLGTVSTVAKISLSDEDNTRGYELTVNGTGYNNGTSAAVHVLADDDVTQDLAAMVAAGTADNNGNGIADEADACSLILTRGQRAGIATVDSDDTVAVTFEVTVPIFKPGNQNFLCMVDGEGRSSSTDVEQFELEPSIRISPDDASVGDTVNVFAQDYPEPGARLTSLKIANQEILTNNLVTVSSGVIGRDGSATATFDMPGSVAGSPLEGTVRVDATWTGPVHGDVKEDAKIALTGSTLHLSVGEARANESVTIQGEGFGSGRGHICAYNITIDGVPLELDDDANVNRNGCNPDSPGDDTKSGDAIEVSNAGQFVVTAYLWNESGTNNPALIAGIHTIRVEDSNGFYGTEKIGIKEPGMTITPEVLGPRDYLTITGTDWPVDNQDSDARVGNVVVEVEDRSYTVVPDGTGRFTAEHRVSRRVAIPSTQQVKATYGAGDIVKVENFDVPAANIEIDPGQGQPGDEVSLTVEGMPVYTEVEEITIGGARVGGNRDFRTDRDGNITADDIPIPGLDPGTYSVIMKVGTGNSQTVAIGSVEVLLEVAPGEVAMLPDALENLGDNLVAVFYFDNVSKAWSFYDPREEFEDLNTLSEMIEAQAYWILVEEEVDEVVLNNQPRSLSCSNDDCWNLEVW